MTLNHLSVRSMQKIYFSSRWQRNTQNMTNLGLGVQYPLNVLYNVWSSFTMNSFYIAPPSILRGKTPGQNTGMQFWLLSEHFVQIWEKNEGAFYLLEFKTKNNSIGIGPLRRYFESLKRLLHKSALFFFSFAEKCTLLSLDKIKLIPFGASNSKSASSMSINKGIKY